MTPRHTPRHTAQRTLAETTREIAFALDAMHDARSPSELARATRGIASRLRYAAYTLDKVATQAETVARLRALQAEVAP